MWPSKVILNSVVSIGHASITITPVQFFKTQVCGFSLMPEWSIDSNALLPFIVILFICLVFPASKTPKGPNCSLHIPTKFPITRSSSPQTHVHIITSPGRRLRLEHSYHIDESPKTLKRKLTKADYTISAMNKRLKFSQQKGRRLSKKVASLQAIVKSMRNKSLVTQAAPICWKDAFGSAIGYHEEAGQPEGRADDQVALSCSPEAVCAYAAILFSESLQLCPPNFQPGSTTLIGNPRLVQKH